VQHWAAISATAKLLFHLCSRLSWLPSVFERIR